MIRSLVPAALAFLVLSSCSQEGRPSVASDGSSDLHEVELGVRALQAPAAGAALAVSVDEWDRASAIATEEAAAQPLEARFLVLAADGNEPELAAIRAALSYRGVPFDVFIATEEPPLTAGRLASGERGLYQAIVLTSGSLGLHGQSTLDATEWSVLADYEARFRVRRAVLSAWPDPALGFAAASDRDLSLSPLSVRCTAAGKTTFLDVNCDLPQVLAGGWAYLAIPKADPSIVPLLVDGAGHALAVIHRGSDGRESLLLFFGNHDRLLHTLVFQHGLIRWVAGGTYLGERRIELAAQVDDLFLASKIWNSADPYRIDTRDLGAARNWLLRRRLNASTPDFRPAFGFNAVKAKDDDPLTQAVRTQTGDWHWISHTYDHAVLDQVDYAAARAEFDQNDHAAATLGLVGYDLRNIITPNVSGLANMEAMRAAVDSGIRFAVTDTSRPGCGNPSPNAGFYNVLAPSVLMVPRRPTDLFYNVSTPAEWMGEYNERLRDDWGRDSTYAQIIEQESDVLLHYLLRGDLDPWMFHQANLRAYDGVHSLLGDLLDATLAKLAQRTRVAVATPPMEVTAARFASRMNVDGAGVRATLYPGRALVIDAARAVTVPVTGLRTTAQEDLAGDRRGRVAVAPGRSSCVPLDATGQGCSPAPLRVGGAGPASALQVSLCNASSAIPPDAGVGDAGSGTSSDGGSVDVDNPGGDGGCELGTTGRGGRAWLALLLLLWLGLSESRRRSARSHR
jgi:hypothetical protein